MTEHAQDHPSSYGQQPGGAIPPYEQQMPQYTGGRTAPPMGGTGQAYGYQTQPPVSPSDARMWSMFAHLGGTFMSFIVPLVIYVVYKDRDPFVRRHAAQALNFHITLFIVYVISYLLVLTSVMLAFVQFVWIVIVIGVITLLAAAICALVFTIQASIAANQGRGYTYPLTFHFVN